MQEVIRPGNTLAGYMAEADKLSYEIMSSIDAAGGEITAETDALSLYLNSIQEQLATKVDAVKFVMDRFEVSAAMLYAQADQFLNAAKALDKAQDRIKEYVKLTMMSMGTDEVLGANWRLALQNTAGSVVVEPGTKLSPEYRIPAASAKDLGVDHLVDAYLFGADGEADAEDEFGSLVVEKFKVVARQAFVAGFECALLELGRINMAGLRKDIKAGKEIPGVSIAPGKSVRAYIRKGD
jgi:hypothetical protein